MARGSVALRDADAKLQSVGCGQWDATWSDPVVGPKAQGALFWATMDRC